MFFRDFAKSIFEPPDFLISSLLSGRGEARFSGIGIAGV